TCVGGAFAQQRQHQQTGDDEGPIGHASDFLHPAADRRAKHDEVKGGGKHWRQDRPERRAEEPHQLVVEDGYCAAQVHAGTSPRSTRSTKMSSRLDSRVSIASKPIPCSTSILITSAASRLPFPLPSPPR